ncbi:MAG TPA: hypothetical protein VMF05_08575 [Stellaceae bacterium]|nr:hypothetical protein [Stellaceae bacterium]
MTRSVVDLAATHLKRQFQYQTQRDRFGRVEALRELAIYARGCIASSLSAGQMTVAFVLERVLHNCASELDRQPVRISEIAELGDRLLSPVTRAVDFLTGAEDDPVEITAALIRARPAQER